MESREVITITMDKDGAMELFDELFDYTDGKLPCDYHFVIDIIMDGILSQLTPDEAESLVGGTIPLPEKCPVIPFGGDDAE